MHDKLQRRWRHLDALGHETQLLCAVPRCECAEHGVLQVKVPWAEPGSRFTAHFEALAVVVISACRLLAQAANESLWQALPPEQRAKVEAAAMDMSAGFVAATRAQAP